MTVGTSKRGRSQASRSMTLREDLMGKAKIIAGVSNNRICDILQVFI